MTSDNSDLTSGVMGWYVTWPVQKLSGFMVSDRAFQGLDDESYYPAPLEQPFEQVRQDRGSKYEDEGKRFTSFPFDPNFDDMKPSPLKKKNALLFKRLFHVFFRDSTYLESGLKFYQMFHPDVFYVYVRGNDYTQHVYWQFMAPQETFRKPSKKDREYFGKIIENYYVYLDEEIGKYMKLADPNTTFLLVSDHGFQGIMDPATKGDLSGGHEMAGIYIFSGPGFRKTFHYDGISIFDFCPLLLYQLGLPLAKDMPGNVPLEVRNTPESNPSFIASYGAPTNTVPRPLPSKVDDEIKDQLRTLGYIN